MFKSSSRSLPCAALDLCCRLMLLMLLTGNKKVADRFAVQCSS